MTNANNSHVWYQFDDQIYGFMQAVEGERRTEIKVSVARLILFYGNIVRFKKNQPFDYSITMERERTHWYVVDDVKSRTSTNHRYLLTACDQYFKLNNGLLFITYWSKLNEDENLLKIEGQLRYTPLLNKSENCDKFIVLIMIF